MKLVSFEPLRTLDLPVTASIKPEDWLRRRNVIDSADWLLFPEYWQVNALHYALNKRIFPSVASYHLGHDKPEMTRALEAVAPHHLPLTFIRAATPRGIEEILDLLSFPFVVKEIRSSMGKGVSLIESAAQFRDYAQTHDILYAQEYLPIRRDLRIVYVGNQVLSAYWRNAAEGSFHSNVAQGGTVSFDDIPAEACDLVTSVAQRLGIDHAGFDVAELDGHFYFFEFNIRFGLQAINSQGISVGRAILRYLEAQSAATPKEAITNAAVQSKPVPSPCVRNCCLNDADICLGCFRSLDEIKLWGMSDRATQQQIIANAEQRKRARDGTEQGEEHKDSPVDSVTRDARAD